MEIIRITLETFISEAMEDADRQIFFGLFREACQKCFGHELETSLSETESKQLSITIFEKTGLVIGVKSIKNYSQFVTGSGRQENPSIATLDTLARFVMEAPLTDETKRKDHEPHHPYWFEYKRMHLRPSTDTTEVNTAQKLLPVRNLRKILTSVGVAIIVAVLLFYFIPHQTHERFTDEFNSVDESVLTENGWRVLAKDPLFWEKRAANAGYLTLYTLRGDNWSDSSNAASISNLLVKEIDPSCFSAEVHFSRFVPQHNWQQAGLLLLEDTLLSSKGIRLTLAYNDFFGGYKQAPEVIIQAISSTEEGGFQKPEEFAHIPIVKIDSTQRTLVANNLSSSALRIEKSGQTFRFLYSTGPMANAAFKEASVRDFKITPRYVGIFAIQGFVPNEQVIPVLVDKFRITPIECP